MLRIDPIATTSSSRWRRGLGCGTWPTKGWIYHHQKSPPMNDSAIFFCILLCRYYIIMISIIHIYIYTYIYILPPISDAGRPQTSYCVSIRWKRLHGTLVICPSPTNHRNCSASQFSRGGPEPKGGGQEHEAKAREADRQQLCLPKSWGAVHTLHSSAFWLLAPYGIALSQKASCLEQVEDLGPLLWFDWKST